MAMFHHDGRFVRAPGLFALARWRGGLRYEVLHLELAEAVHRTATPDHPRWAWALAAGMDTLLVHLLGASASVLEDIDPAREAVWRPEAEVALGEREPVDDAPLWVAAAVR
jgi:hypothetical protein